MLTKTPTCPACGQPCSGRAPRINVDLSTCVARLGAEEMVIGRRMSLALHALAKAYPEGLSVERLYFAMYADALDDPPGTGTLHAHVSRIRKHMREAGWPWTITNSRYVGYKLKHEDMHRHG